MKHFLYTILFVINIHAVAQNKGFYYNVSIGTLRYSNIGILTSVGVGYSFGKHIITNNFEVSELINPSGITYSGMNNSRRQRYWSILNLNYSYLVKSGKNSFVFPVVGIAPIVQFNSRDEKAVVGNNRMMYNLGIGYKFKITKKIFITSQLNIHPMNAHFIYIANGATIAPTSKDKMIFPLSFKIGASQ